MQRAAGDHCYLSGVTRPPTKSPAMRIWPLPPRARETPHPGQKVQTTGEDGEDDNLEELGKVEIASAARHGHGELGIVQAPRSHAGR